MRIKRYVVQDMAEAMELIKADLGPEAVIISSRKVRSKGLLGFFQLRLEVTAALDEPYCRPEPVAAAAAAVAGGGRPPAVTASRPMAVPEPVSELRRELTEIKGMLVRFTPGAQAGDDGEGFCGEWRRLLEEMEISPDLTAHLMSVLKSRVAPGEIEQNDLARTCLQNEIVRMVEPAYAKPTQSRVLAFVGPTGVGKTTTLAKMAANYTLFHGKSGAIITIDTYRIGAVEQLKTYAEIIGVPLEIVMSPREFAEAVHRHRTKDLIFVDTAGRPARNTEQVAELQSYFAVLEEGIDIVLVLSANTKHRDLLQAVRQFGQVNYTKLIFTKVDETDTLGCILNVICHTGIPVIQITDGQTVPDDIQSMYPRKLAKLLTKGVEPDA